MAAQTKVTDFSFEEKVRIFSRDYLKCCVYLTRVEPTRFTYTKKFYSTLIFTSQLLEDLLDFHGAKNSQKWYFYRELSAAVRHISLAAYQQKHIFNRVPMYDIQDMGDLEKQGNKTHAFLVATLQRLAPAILREARRLKLPIPKKTYDVADFPRISTAKVLPPDIDDQENGHRSEAAAKVAGEFLGVASKFEHLTLSGPVDLDAVHSMVPSSVNEVEIRRHEMLVHNLQSEFDSYVSLDGFRHGEGKVKRLRGYFSIILHLLELSGALLHFYERHLRDMELKSSYKQVRDKLALLVDPDKLLDRTINYGLVYASRFFTQGTGLAQEILAENVETSSVTVPVPQKLGFHLRPSLLVSKIVQHYGGPVELIAGDSRFDAGSPLDLQWAGGKIKKEDIQEVVFQGDSRALHDIRILAGVNYGEDTMGKGRPLPKELEYLR